MTPMRGQRPTVLLTRSDEDNALIAPQFQEAGLATIAVPGIRIVPPVDWAPCDSALANLQAYHGILFTSRYAVRSFLGRLALRHTHIPSLLQGLKVAAIGKKTEEALEREGITPDILPDVGSARSLADSLGPSEVLGKRYLFPKSNIARDELPAELRGRGALVDEVVVYQTTLPDMQAVNDVRDGLLDGAISYTAFFSPSAVRNIIEMFGVDCFGRTTIAAVGPTTASAADAAGLRPEIIAATPRTEDLIAAIVEHAAGRRTSFRTLSDT